MSIFDALDVTFDSTTVSFDGYPVVPDFPIVTIEAAFGYGVSTPIASMSWTAIGKWVLKVDTQRGKQHERNVVQAGTATFLLDNRDGRFSPWNTSSPYAGNVLPMVPIRVRSTWAGVDYPVWFGYVESWPQKWHDAVNSEVEVTAVDGFKRLSLASLAVNAYYHDIVMADSPSAYWRLGDSPVATSAADSSGNAHNGTLNGTLIRGVTGAITSATDTATTFGYTSPTAIQPLGWINGGTVITGTASFTIEAWIKTPSVASTGRVWPFLFLHDPAGTGFQLDFGLHAITSNPFVTFEGVGSAAGVNGGPAIDDDAWHHLAITRNGTAWTLYLDGNIVGTQFDNPSYPAATYVGIGGNLNGPQWPGSIDEVAIYPTALAAARILTHYQAGSGFVPASTGLRIAAVLDNAGWATADRSLDAGITIAPGETRSLASTKALSYIQEVELAEAGIFYMAADGKATFKSRYHPLLAATSTGSQVTFGGGVSEEPYRLDGTDVGMDDSDIWNQAVVGRLGGNPQPVVDAASEDSYGQRSLPDRLELLLASDAEAFDRASWDVAHYKDPQVRVGAVNIDPRSDPTNLFPKVLGLDLLDRVTFKRETLDGGSTFQADQLIEGADHHITPSSWRTVWHLAPADTGSYWIWDSAPWGTTTKWAY